jgi:hypothetical protein
MALYGMIKQYIFVSNREKRRDLGEKKTDETISQ